MAIKSIESLMSEAQGAHGLKRTLSAFNLVTLGIGAIIGTGIFVLTGTAAAQHAGPALVLSFILSGIGCAFAGLCYAEFASMIPIAGSAYTYAYATMGRFMAWIIGWDLILEYLVGASTVAVGWSGYMVSFLHGYGIHLPAELIAATGTKLIQIPQGIENLAYGWQPLTTSLIESLRAVGIEATSLPASTAILNLPAMFIIALMSTLLVIGMQESARFNSIIVIIKVAVILLFIGFGMYYINPDNWHPFIPENTGTWGEFGWSGILSGAGVIFFAYIGFDAVSTAAQEAKNPQKDMPKGILGSLIVCTILYILVAMVMTGIVKYDQLNVPAPIAVAIDSTGSALAWLSPLVKVGAIAGLSSVILVMLMGQPRIFYSMAKDGLFPKWFASIHPKFGTPHVTTILTGVVAMILSGIFPIDTLGHMVAIGTLFAFAVVCIGVIVLRRTKPNLHRPFKTPMVPLIPILGALICIAQMFGLGLETWIRLIAWMAIGMAIYYFYGRKRGISQDAPLSDAKIDKLDDPR